MRYFIITLCLSAAGLCASPAMAGRFDDVEDAAEEYRDAVRDVRRDVDEDGFAPHYLYDLVHHLEDAANALEKRSDDNDPLHEMLGAYEHVAALHHRFAESTYDQIPYSGRHAVEHVSDVHRRFHELAVEVDQVAYPAPIYQSDRTVVVEPPIVHRRIPITPPHPSPYEELPPPQAYPLPMDPNYGDPIYGDPVPLEIRPYPPTYPTAHYRYPPQRNLRSQLIDAVLTEIFD